MAGGHKTLWCPGLEHSCLGLTCKQQCKSSLLQALEARRSGLKALSSSEVKGSGGYLATRTQRHYLKVKRPVRWPLTRFWAEMVWPELGSDRGSDLCHISQWQVFRRGEKLRSPSCKSEVCKQGPEASQSSVLNPSAGACVSETSCLGLPYFLGRPRDLPPPVWVGRTVAASVGLLA